MHVLITKGTLEPVFHKWHMCCLPTEYFRKFYTLVILWYLYNKRLENILAITRCLLPSKPWSNASMEAAGVLMTSLHLRGRPWPHSSHFRNDPAQELAQSLTSKGVMANRSGANHQRKRLPAIATNSCQLFLLLPLAIHCYWWTDRQWTDNNTCCSRFPPLCCPETTFYWASEGLALGDSLESLT